MQSLHILQSQQAGFDLVFGQQNGFYALYFFHKQLMLVIAALTLHLGHDSGAVVGADSYNVDSIGVLAPLALPP